MSRFQSTHPCGVRLKPVTQNAAHRCFNPRTRVGCDRCVYALYLVKLVSIHAPVWGATSIDLSSYKMPLFQSTHPCGVRPPKDLEATDLRVSIHAPVWGATGELLNEIRTKTVSIHAPVWGATINIIFLTGFVVFQSTHPCGVRRQ